MVQCLQRVWGLELRVESVGIEVEGCEGLGSRAWVLGFGSRVSCFGCGDYGFLRTGYDAFFSLGFGITGAMVLSLLSLEEDEKEEVILALPPSIWTASVCASSEGLGLPGRCFVGPVAALVIAPASSRLCMRLRGVGVKSLSRLKSLSRESHRLWVPTPEHARERQGMSREMLVTCESERDRNLYLRRGLVTCIYGEGS